MMDRFLYPDSRQLARYTIMHVCIYNDNHSIPRYYYSQSVWIISLNQMFVSYIVDLDNKFFFHCFVYCYCYYGFYIILRTHQS